MRKRQKITLLIIIGIIIIFCIGFYLLWVRPASFQDYTESNSVQTEASTLTYLSNKKLVQSFEVDNDIKSFSVSFFFPGADTGELITVQLQDQNGNIYFQETYTFNELKENSKFILEEEITGKQGEIFEIVIKGSPSNTTDSIGVLTSVHSEYSEGELFVDGKSTQQDIAFSLTGGNCAFLNSVYIIFVLFILFSVILIYYFVLVKKATIEKCFAVIALVCGIIYLFLGTPYSGYDEAAHMDTAYRFSDLMMGNGFETETGGYLRRSGDTMEGFTQGQAGLSQLKVIHDELFSFSSDSRLIEVKGRNVSQNPFFYGPAALGITIARLFNLGRVPMIYLARLLNLLYFIGMAYFSIKRAPLGKMIFAAVGLLPMTLSLAASFSYDAFMMGITFLCISYLLALIYEKEKIKTKDLFLFIIFAALMAPAKVIYILILGLIFLIPRERFSNSSKYYRTIVMILGFSILSLVIFNFSSVVNIFLPKVSRYPGTEGLSYYSLGYALTHIPYMISIAYNTLIHKLDHYLTYMIGGVYTQPLSIWLCSAFGVTLLLSALKTEKKPLLISKKHKICYAVVFLGVFVAAHLAMLTSFTIMGSPVVEGVQGRYLLPVLPLILLLGRSGIVVLKKNIDKSLLFIAFSLHGVAAIQIFQRIITR